MREYLSLPERKFTSSSWSSWSLKTKQASRHLWAEQPAWNERTLWWKWTSAQAAQNAEKGNLWKLKLRQWCLAGESISKWLLCEAASILGPKMGNVIFNTLRYLKTDFSNSQRSKAPFLNAPWIKTNLFTPILFHLPSWHLTWLTWLAV